jgi:CBS-domain-containing membrane protein
VTTFAYPVVPNRILLRRSVAGDLMNQLPIALEEQTTIQEATQLLRQRALDAAPIVDETGGIVGVVTLAACNAWKEFTLRSAPERFSTQDLGPNTVMEIANPNVPTIRANASGQELMERFLQRRVRRIYVTDDYGRLVGVISASDMLRRLT